MNSMRVLVSGASGPIGSGLLAFLPERGFSVTRLIRGAASGADQISWNPSQQLPPDSMSGFDAVVHLSGETIVGRWTEGKKRKILESRAEGTRRLAEAAARAVQLPQVFISASAVGYYGNRGDEILSESAEPGDGFLADVCRQWEAATKPAAEAGIRTAQMRFGVVMSATGGALPKMLLPFRLGLGGRLGDGRQWWSWVSIEDVVGAIHHALISDSMQGPVNTVAPNPVTNAEFTKTLASALKRPALFPMPRFAVGLVFGEMGEELFLASQRVVPAKLQAGGYQFQYSDLGNALEDILK
jgi:uncharacterized protein (TIGR01777 family)